MRDSRPGRGRLVLEQPSFLVATVIVVVGSFSKVFFFSFLFEVNEQK